MAGDVKVKFHDIIPCRQGKGIVIYDLEGKYITGFGIFTIVRYISLNKMKKS